VTISLTLAGAKIYTHFQGLRWLILFLSLEVISTDLFWMPQYIPVKASFTCTIIIIHVPAAFLSGHPERHLGSEVNNPRKVALSHCTYQWRLATKYITTQSK